MEREREIRRLAAVLHADVVGYSRHMEQDESETHDRLTAMQRDVLGPCASLHTGRVVHIRGDGILMEFQSAVDAVRFSIDFQERMAELNADKPPERQIELRIGINIGDIIVDRGEIFGNGVNVAVRMEGLAPAGGVCISGTVADQIGNQVDVSLTAIGAQKIKNIAKPVDAFWIERGKKAELRALRMRVGARRGLAAAVAAAVIAMFGGFGIAHYATGPAVPPGYNVIGPDIVPMPVTDKPSLAVLPFSNMSPDPDQDYLVDGISEDLITDLSRISGLFVIARNSTFAYKDKAVDIRRVGRDLGVRYVLEGSVRKAGEALRINAQLIEAKTGTHVWAERYDRKFKELFVLQDDITTKIVNALEVTLTAQERTRAGTAPTQVYEAYDAYLRGLTAYRRNSFEGFPEAVANFKQAVLLDPDFTLAHAALAATYLAAHRNGWSSSGNTRTMETVLTSPSVIRSMNLELARRSLQEAMRAPMPWAYRVAAEIATLDGNYDLALRQIATAIDLSPNDPENYARQGLLFTWVSRKNMCGNRRPCDNVHERNALAIANIKRAMRLDPANYKRYLAILGTAEYAAGNYPDAATYLERATSHTPDDDWLHIHLIAAYGQMGHRENAGKSLVHLRHLAKRQKRLEYSIKEVRNRSPYRFVSDTDHLLYGLYLAEMRDTHFGPDQ